MFVLIIPGQTILKIGDRLPFVVSRAIWDVDVEMWSGISSSILIDSQR